MGEFSLMKAEILVTQKCNLVCSYCSIIKNPVKDISTSEWKDNFTMLKEMGLSFAVLYGGEPFCRKDIPDLVEYLNEIKLPYTVITNGTMREEEVRWCLDKMPGFTVSIDWPYDQWKSVEECPKIHKDSFIKSLRGWKWLEEATKKNIPDRVACITVNSKNLPLLAKITAQLLSMDVWVITTLLHHSTNERYTYRARTKDCLDMMFGLFDKEELIFQAELLKDRFYRGEKIHNIPAYYDFWGKDVCFNLDWKCDGFQCLSIMPDGSLRPCLDWPGEGLISKYKIKDLYDNKNDIRERINEVVAEDMKACGGCFWDPKIMSSFLLETKFGREHGGEFFDHFTVGKERVDLYEELIKDRYERGL